MKRILIYGTGKAAEYYVNNHAFINESIIGFLETNKSKDVYYDKTVYSVDVLSLIEWDEIHVVNAYVETIHCLLRKAIAKDKIVICNEKLCKDYVNGNNGILDIKYNHFEARKYEHSIENSGCYVLMRPMNASFDIWGCKEDNFLGERCIRNDDYCRLGTLRLLIEEIKRHQVGGDIAELGVYRGDFARLLNESFPDRRLFLFDTFEGFEEKDVEYEQLEGYTSTEWFDGWDYFRNTSIDFVMSKMNYPENCVIQKGYFPDTIPNEEHVYAFVSLDCDLYRPILEGLKYFYPRLQKGGYIMLHDYNQESYLQGVKQAVDAFEKESGHIVKVPITDVCGTLVISK